MKYLKKIFENSENNKRLIEDCFLEISENLNFKVSELIDENRSERTRGFSDEIVYKLNIGLSDSLSLPQPISSNLYIGMVKTDLEFLKMKHQKISELLDDIEVSLNRFKDIFPESKSQIYANRREEIDVVMIIKK